MSTCRFVRSTVLVAFVLAAGCSASMATCTEGVFPIFQCGFVSWFAPPPPDAGTVSAIWWQLGFGNNLVNNGVVSSALEGTGTVLVAGGIFPGNDSGVAGMLLKSADQVLPQFAALIPDGALCADYENSWGGFGVDGCADNLPTTSALMNDNIMNPYWSTAYGPCAYDDCVYETNGYLVDQPIAVLARESNNKYFALAFVATHGRGGDSTQANEGVFNLGAVSNGIPNTVTGLNNVIPWQPVPTPHISHFNVPDPNTRIVTLSWNSPLIIHDGSDRSRGAGDTTPASYPQVGVLNHLAETGGLCRMVLQWAIDPGGPPNPSQLPWITVGTFPCQPAGGITSTSVTMPRFSTNVVRLRTILGKQPRTTSTSIANARLGIVGDLGFEATDCKADNCVNSPPLAVVFSPLASEKAVDMKARKDRNVVRVSFRTTAELSVESLAILGKDDAVLATLNCKQCVTGVGDGYEASLPAGQIKGAKTLKVRLNGPNEVSEPFPVE